SLIRWFSDNATPASVSGDPMYPSTWSCPPDSFLGSEQLLCDLNDRVILVTGASGGIGRATARTLAEAGGSVVLHDVRADGPIQDLRVEIGDAATIVAADLAAPEKIEALWTQALAWRGRIDV